MNASKIVLYLICTLLYPCAAQAQLLSVGSFQSYKGLGVSIQSEGSDSQVFNTYTLYADMASVFAGSSKTPGVKFNFSHNFRLLNFPSAIGEDFCLYAGSGVSTGWVQDYMRSDFGLEAALTGTFGARMAFKRSILITFGITLDAGAIVFKENGNLKFSVYRNGVYQSIYPHIEIAYRFL